MYLFCVFSKKELNNDRFVDPNILGASTSYIQIYESIEFRPFSLTEMNRALGHLCAHIG